MDLWKEFEMHQRMADFWQDIGMSAGTAIVVLIVLYFIIKWAVKNGILEAYKEITKKKAQQNLTTDQRARNLDLGGNETSNP